MRFDTANDFINGSPTRLLACAGPLCSGSTRSVLIAAAGIPLNPVDDRHVLVYTYDVIFGLVSNACDELFVMSNSVTSTRGHAYKLFQRYFDSR